MLTTNQQAWRLLTRSYLEDSEQKRMLAYTPMFHARLFQESPKFRDVHFLPTKESLMSKKKSNATPFLDGNPELDRPLFVQFCANKPEEFLEAAQYVAPYCDAVDLNLGCPQGIAKSGNYGAFLQEDWTTIEKLIQKLRDELEVPVTAKFRIQETKEKTLAYARMILSAGASILTVHGRQRHQKGHNTGLADWQMIRYLRDNLPPDTVLFANGNVLNRQDVQPCLDATGADGVMSAEGNLSDPTIFAKPPADRKNREYWYDTSNPEIGGYRVDGVFRRYLDIIYRHVLEHEPPQRRPLFVPGDEERTTVFEHVPVEVDNANITESNSLKRSHEELDLEEEHAQPNQKLSKKQKRKQERKGGKKDLTAVHNPNLKPLQGHLFQLLRTVIVDHTNIRDALAQSRAGDLTAFEHVLYLVEEAVKEGLKRAETEPWQNASTLTAIQDYDPANPDRETSATVRLRCQRPFWVCQPHIRPLPEEAIKTGALQTAKKEKPAAKSEAIKPSPDAAQTLETKSQASIAEGVVVTQTTPAALQAKISRELPQKEALSCG